MNDLRNGVVDINGFLLGPNTTLEEMEEYFKIPGIRGNVCRRFTLGGKSFENNGIVFKIDVDFDEKVNEVKLYPQIPELIKKYDAGDVAVGLIHDKSTGDPDKDLAYFKEIRVFLDEWLEKQLGTPSLKDNDVTEYKLNGILIGTDSYIENSRDVFVHGGTVDIYYWW